MSASPITWMTAVGLSIALNVGLAGLMGLSIDPKPVEPQPRPESRIELAAYPVKRETAGVQRPKGENAEESEKSGTSLGGGEIPSTKTAGLTSEKNAVSTIRPDGSRIESSNEIATPLNPVDVTDILGGVEKESELSADSLRSSEIPSTKTSTIASRLDTVSATQSSGQRVTNSFEKAPAVNLAETSDIAVAAVSDNAPTVTAASPVVEVTSSDPLPTDQTSNIQPNSAKAQNIAPKIELASTAPLGSERQTAALAWSSEGQSRVDPASLAAIQSFMTEGELSDTDQNIGSVRDGIDALLAQVPCSRLQVEFSPETGQLELRGHVPEEGLRAPIREALQSQIGESIPVADNLLILPRPQCGALAGIANAGLPQSTDQRTNPRLIGPDTHTRLYGFVEGERLIFDLVAPDYDAHIYVDYFDAAGNVIHLVPNERVSLEKFAAKTTLQIGADRADENFLAVRIGPPFGQEIATAFAANVPLYDGVRPLVEPASAYLEWLQEQVAKAREADPEFKGEWVYFFVKTTAQ